MGQTIYDIYVDVPDLQKQLGTFGSFPTAQATLILNKEGLLKPGQLEKFRDAMLKQQQKGYEFRLGNRELGANAGACIAAFKLFSKDPAFESTRSQFLAWWAKQNEVGDLDENAGNYSSLGLSEMLRMVREMGREEDLKNSPKWRNTFERYRAMVTPSGYIPEFNDDFFEEGGKHVNDYLLEYAANQGHYGGGVHNGSIIVKDGKFYYIYRGERPMDIEHAVGTYICDIGVAVSNDGVHFTKDNAHKWWLYYGGSEYYTCLATTPEKNNEIKQS